MIIRHYLKWSVCTLFITAIVCFFMIFIISLTLIESLHDKIKDFTPLALQNRTTWGSIPGTLKYNYTRSIYLFNIDELNLDDGLMEMSS